MVRRVGHLAQVWFGAYEGGVAPVAGRRGDGIGALLGVSAAHRDQAESDYHRLAEENR